MNFAKLILAIAALMLICGPTARAQSTVHLLIGYSGVVDTIARVYAEKLAEGIGRPVVVEIRSGAGGQIAVMALKASAPDGNTLLVLPDTAITLYPHTFKTLPYDAFKDFVPIAHVGGADYALAVGAGVPANNLKEWINWVKADKKNAIYATAGAGTIPHFMGLMLAQEIGVPLVHVPYRSTPQAITNLIGGQLPAVITSFANLHSQARAGKIRILAHPGGRWTSIAPGVASFKELGYTALEAATSFIICAPAGIRPELVARYNEIITQAQRTAAVRERMASLDLDLREMTPAEIAAMLKVEHNRWGGIVKASGFSAGDNQ